MSCSSAHGLTGGELQPRADLVNGGGAAEAEEAEAEHAGPHGPQGDAHQHRHRLEGGQRGQAGQAPPAVRDGPVRVHAHLEEQGRQEESRLTVRLSVSRSF